MKKKNIDTSELEADSGWEDVACTEQGKHDPESWSGIIREQGQRMRRENQAFLDKLGEPHHIERISEYQYGYWRLVGGVIRLTRWGDDCPWDYYSRCEFPDAEINILSNLQDIPPKTDI